ncbi:MAG TPA: sigma 54-interacting transcriptional regulator [Candidatus Dormibacteraeota bacterium]|nr:sigma 54-interacting transcriptional regulator [Candidatus Dormibacteraeota bacterium]
MASPVYSHQSSWPARWPVETKFEERAPRKILRSEEVVAEQDVSPATEESIPRVFEGMIGTSEALKRVLAHVKTVASTDSTVLLEGETGTGKELISRAVHALSQRKTRNFVKFNCAAIPLGLLESELFGHERGAFTGAISRKIGRFELADQGTLFLDEVGDIPLELQAKLLRVLQEQEFEKLGSTQTQKVNVRFVAATNRNLAELVSDKEFRDDLYFRLNVFPIVIPPLRERREDIPLLTEFFVQEFSRQMNRHIDTILASTMEQLIEYSWPGNIRELQNFIERAVILSTGSTLFAPVGDLKSPVEIEPAATTLKQAESGHILKILRETRWVVGGPRGAAARLGLKRTTLVGKMKRLGLSRPDYEIVN